MRRQQFLRVKLRSKWIKETESDSESGSTFDFPRISRLQNLISCHLTLPCPSSTDPPKLSEASVGGISDAVRGAAVSSVKSDASNRSMEMEGPGCASMAGAAALIAEEEEAERAAEEIRKRMQEAPVIKEDEPLEEEAEPVGKKDSQASYDVALAGPKVMERTATGDSRAGTMNRSSSMDQSPDTRVFGEKPKQQFTPTQSRSQSHERMPSHDRSSAGGAPTLAGDRPSTLAQGAPIGEDEEEAPIVVPFDQSASRKMMSERRTNAEAQVTITTSGEPAVGSTGVSGRMMRLSERLSLAQGPTQDQLAVHRKSTT